MHVVFRESHGLEETATPQDPGQSPADLVVLGVSSWHELLAVAPRRRVLRGGVWLPPPPTEEPSPLLAFADSCRHP